MRRTPIDLHSLSPGTRELIELNVKRRIDFRRTPEKIYRWWRRCTVKVLLVTDGNLNFGEGDFGLSTFVRILKNDAPAPVRFELTLAHINNVPDADMLAGEPGIAARIKNFRFDDPAHFTPDQFDQVWLFGISTSYAGMPGRNTFLAPAEIDAVHAHMQRGGGVFATGDHGFLGQALFERTRIDADAAGERADLYQLASTYAGRFCRRVAARLADGTRGATRELLCELRRFYRWGNARKLRFIEQQA